MNNKNVFLEEEIPYKKLEKIGIDRKSILQMPKELIEPLLGGRQTPLIQAAFKTTEGKIMQIPLKLQLVRDKEGNASIMVFPARKEVNNDIKLSPYELERLQKGEILKKEVNNDGTRRVKFIQLDRETNKAVSTCKCTARKVKEYFRKNTQKGYENLIFLSGDGLFFQQLC